MYSLMFWLGILLPDLWEIPSLNYQSITSGATEAMNVTLDEFEFGSKYLQSRGWFRQGKESYRVMQAESESTLVNQDSNKNVTANNIVPFARKAATVAA